MALTTPTADLYLSYTPGANGVLEVDLAHDGSGDYRLVSGGDRLRQDVLRWLLTPIGGNPFDPSFGNPLIGLVGRPQGGTAPYTDMLNQAQHYFIQRQAEDAAQGWLSLDEQIDHFGPPSVTSPQNGLVIVSFVIYTKAATSISVKAPLLIGVAAS